jgi:MoxR-like ATPase
VPRPTAVIDKGRILEMRELVRKVPLARQIQDYAVRVVLATHPENPEATALSKQFMRYGASPRGLQAIILAAKIRALLEGRYAVAIDDIRHVAPPALRHRLILNFEGEAEGVKADTIIAEILKATKEA